MDRPAALVVYESMFGNTEEVAKAVAEGLRLEGVETTVVEARSAPHAVARDLDLLVVGAPTHAFSLSRAASRQDAVSQGAAPQRADLGVREWLESCRHDRRSPVALAAFDTRMSRVRWLPQSGLGGCRSDRAQARVPRRRPPDRVRRRGHQGAAA
jgi:hypothetical protein